MIELADRKVTLVTGTARGIGRASTLGLANAGYVLAACERSSAGRII